jgi:hypothetical protein
MARAYDRAQRLTKIDPDNADWLLLRAKIECDLLNPELGLASMPLPAVRRSLDASVRSLREKRTPRIGEIRKCLSTSIN